MRTLLLLAALIVLIVSSCSNKGTSDNSSPNPEPSLQISSPTNGEVVSEVATVAVSVKGERLDSVSFYVDNLSSPIETDSSEPFSALWNVSDYQDSTSHRIYATGFFGHSDLISSDTVQVIVDNRISRPNSVILENPILVTAYAVTLHWGISNAVDFQCYRVFSSDLPGVTEASQLVCTATDKTVDSVTLVYGYDNVTKYYRVFVYDVYNLHSGSNEIGVTTLNSPPPAVILESAVELGDLEVGLVWTQCKAHDFVQYEVRRGASSDVTRESHLVSQILHSEDTSYVDRTVNGPSQYYYEVFTLDTGDSVSGSNEMVVQVSDPRPTEPNLISATPEAETSIRIVWNSCPDIDFCSCKLFRATWPAVTDASDEVCEILLSSDTSYLDVGLYPGTRYYYRAYNYDCNGFQREGKVLSAATLDVAPESVDLSKCGSLSDSSVCLVWSRNRNIDFDYYRICRKSSPNVSEPSPTLTVLYDADDTTYTDDGLVPGEEYFYRVFVYDKAGNPAGSNELPVMVSEAMAMVSVRSSHPQATQNRQFIEDLFAFFHIAVNFNFDIDSIDNYQFVVLADDGNAVPANADRFGQYVHNGGNLLLCGGAPYYLAGGTSLSPIADWFGADSYLNGDGICLVTNATYVDHGFQIGDTVFVERYVSKGAVSSLRPGAVAIAEWRESSWGTNGWCALMVNTYASGKILYYSITPYEDYSQYRGTRSTSIFRSLVSWMLER